MSSKSSVPQAASFVSHVLMSDSTLPSGCVAPVSHGRPGRLLERRSISLSDPPDAVTRTSQPAPPPALRDDQKESPRRISSETTADENIAGEIETAELEAYLAHLVHLDVPLPLKIELIRTLRQIMQSFVDRAFGDDPAQLARQGKGDPD